MQQIAPSNVILEYGPQQPILIPGGATYGYSPHARPLHLQGYPPRSLLDEFRSNKSRQWELKVRNRPAFTVIDFFMLFVAGPIWLRGGIWQRSARLSVYPRETEDCLQRGERRTDSGDFPPPCNTTYPARLRELCQKFIRGLKWISLIDGVCIQVIQQLFELGTELQRTQLANVMKGHILSCSLHMYGCRVVQKVGSMT